MAGSLLLRRGNVVPGRPGNEILANGNVLPVGLEDMESMKDYVVRRAREVKDYKRVAAEAEVGYDWLNKIARDAIPNPGVDRVEKLYHYYKGLEVPRRRRAA